MGEDELGDRAGIAWQQLAVGPAGHAVVGRLNRLLGRDALLVRGGRSADADQAGDLCDLEPGVAVQQEMAEQTAGVVIVAAVLPEGEGRLQQPALLGCQTFFDKLSFRKPLCTSTVRGVHERFSLHSWQREIVVRKD
jgi:hypothetical protein